MIKRIVFVLCLFCSMAGFAQSELKFGHIDSQRFIESMPETKEALKKLDEISKKFDSELTKMNDEFNRKYTEYASQADTLPPSIKARRAQEVTELQQRITDFRETAGEEMQQQQQALIMPIQEKVKKAVDEVAAEESLIYVFDTAVLLYQSDQSIDIAPLLKKKLRLE